MHTIYTDGACQPNPGPCGFGVVILDENEKIIALISEFIGHGTNNTGELAGILRGITKAKELGLAEVNLFTDSEVCVKLLKKKSTNVAHLQPILERCVQAMTDITVNVAWVKGHANIKWNEVADRLANSALAFLNADVQTGTRPKTPPPTLTVSPSLFPSTIQPSVTMLELKCPFAEKDEAKRLGAKWDTTKKKWVAKDTKENRDIFAKWI
jgi:ribonuclease HI